MYYYFEHIGKKKWHQHPARQGRIRETYLRIDWYLVRMPPNLCWRPRESGTVDARSVRVRVQASGYRACRCTGSGREQLRMSGEMQRATYMWDSLAPVRQPHLSWSKGPCGSCPGHPSVQHEYGLGARIRCQNRLQNRFHCTTRAAWAAVLRQPIAVATDRSPERNVPRARLLSDIGRDVPPSPEPVGAARNVPPSA